MKTITSLFNPDQFISIASSIRASLSSTFATPFSWSQTPATQPESRAQSQFMKHISASGDATYFLDGSWKKKDICKKAQAMPPLVKAVGPLSIDEQDLISYHEMPAGARHYICGPNGEDEPVRSHFFVNEDMIRDAGVWELIVKAQAVLLKKRKKIMMKMRKIKTMKMRMMKKSLINLSLKKRWKRFAQKKTKKIACEQSQLVQLPEVVCIKLLLVYTSMMHHRPHLESN